MNSAVLKRSLKLAVVALVTGWACAPPSLDACSVPVFRYALERWPADPYGLVIYHRGALTPEQKSLVQKLEDTGMAGEARANFEVITVDLAADPDSHWLEVWKAHQQLSLPAIVLRYPPMFRIPVSVWSGPLTAATVKQVIDSPARHEIARRLIGGDSAVWVLLEMGDKARDEAAAKVLETRLKHLEQELKLPEIDPADVARGYLSVPTNQLKVAFSTLRLSRQTAAERVFVRMLLGTEADLNELKEPIAFPVFGRGRALFALVGKGIVNDNIDEACYFLTGPCSCQVKELNPGVDLLMAVNWDDQVYAMATGDEAPPELTSLAGFDEAPPPKPAPTNAPSAAPPPVQQALAVPAAVPVVAKITNAPPAASPPAPTGPSRIMVGVVAAGALGLLVVAGASFFLWRRKP